MTQPDVEIEKVQPTVIVVSNTLIVTPMENVYVIQTGVMDPRILTVRSTLVIAIQDVLVASALMPINVMHVLPTQPSSQALAPVNTQHSVSVLAATLESTVASM